MMVFIGDLPARVVGCVQNTRDIDGTQYYLLIVLDLDRSTRSLWHKGTLVVFLTHTISFRLFQMKLLVMAVTVSQ